MHIGYGSWRNEIEMVMKTGWVIYIDLEVEVYIWLARKLMDEPLWDSACFLYRWSIICMCYVPNIDLQMHPSMCLCIREGQSTRCDKESDGAKLEGRWESNPSTSVLGSMVIDTTYIFLSGIQITSDLQPLHQYVPL